MAHTFSKLIDASFPTELLLEVIQQVPFDATTMTTLAMVHPRLHSILANYEGSITKKIARKQLPHAMTDFPYYEKNIGYAWLSQCIHQYDVIDDIMAILISDLNCFAIESQNMALVNIGLLLLYHLSSIDIYNDQLDFIKALPRDPLTAIFLAIHFSTLTARYHGKGIINQRTYGRGMDINQFDLRNEIEFCFKEGAMNMGPGYILDVLLHVDTAEIKLMNLYHDHGIHDWDMDAAEGEFMPPLTQGPALNPETRPRTLFTTIMERLALLYQCPLDGVVGMIIDDVEPPDHSLAWLGLGEKARLVQGLDLEHTKDT